MIGITENEFVLLAEYIKSNYGIQMKQEKQSLLSGRLQQVLSSRGYNNFTDYFHYLKSDRTGEAMSTLINKISTNHTFFMREPSHFDFFRDHALPHFTQTIRDGDLRVWSAGCSSGEEPYTLAMIIDDYLGSKKSHWNAKLLATDISGQALEAAIAGIYEAERLERLPKQWKLNYFKAYDASHYSLTPSIKQEVIFRKFNLMDPVFPFKRKFHCIFCRNVMIYFDAATRETLIQKFYEALEPGGYLFIGHSESIVRDTSSFQYVMPAVYRKG